MTAKLIGLELVLLAFLALTAHAVGTMGYFGFFEAMGANAATQLAMADLVICLSILAVFIFRDARERQLPWLPYLAIALFFGAAGPLAYLIHREFAVRPRAARAQVAR